MPKVRLVSNVGQADSRATHTGGYVYWAKDWAVAGAIGDRLIPPPSVACDDSADRLRERMEGAVLPRGLTWLGAKFPWMCGFLSAAGGAIEKIAPILFRL